MEENMASLKTLCRLLKMKVMYRLLGLQLNQCKHLLSACIKMQSDMTVALCLKGQ